MLTKTSKRKSLGFSLIEIIVAGAIVAILSAVAIPMYTGYVKNAQKELAANLARTVAISANAYQRNPSNPALPTNTDLKGILNIFLPNAANFNVILTTSDSISVTDIANVITVKSAYH